jgi:hypothetical protein
MPSSAAVSTGNAIRMRIVVMKMFQPKPAAPPGVRNPEITISPPNRNSQ